MPNYTYSCGCNKVYRMFKYSTDAPERVRCSCGGLANIVLAESTTVKDPVNQKIAKELQPVLS